MYVVAKPTLYQEPTEEASHSINYQMIIHFSILGDSLPCHKLPKLPTSSLPSLEGRTYTSSSLRKVLKCPTPWSSPTGSPKLHFSELSLSWVSMTPTAQLSREQNINARFNKFSRFFQFLLQPLQACNRVQPL